jgi:hypothetical protein
MKRALLPLKGFVWMLLGGAGLYCIRPDFYESPPPSLSAWEIVGVNAMAVAWIALFWLMNAGDTE